MKVNHPNSAILDHALKLLARREHSRFELHHKLQQKGWSEEQIQEVLSELSESQLQSDTRFIEMYIRHRTEAGYGPHGLSGALPARYSGSSPAVGG